MKCPYRKAITYTRRVEHGSRHSALVGGSHYFTQNPCNKDNADTISEDFMECLQSNCGAYLSIGRCGAKMHKNI